MERWPLGVRQLPINWHKISAMQEEYFLEISSTTLRLRITILYCIFKYHAKFLGNEIK